MTLGDKFRFLADRLEDGKPFLMDDVECVFGDNMLQMESPVISIRINKMKSADLKLKPTWEFTGDEKAILRKVASRWRWIARDDDGMLNLYDKKPYKISDMWGFSPHNFTSFSCFRHIFQSVQWEDDEPCEFREYI